jgi:hypothetical protein
LDGGKPARTVVYDEPVDFTAAITHEDPWYVARRLDVEVASQVRERRPRRPWRI